MRDNVGEGSDQISVNGHSKHVISYLQDFLFTPERACQPVRVLSGGERNRLLLAKLFAKPANLLVMDEPTNDLDIETLELLEELLTDFQGTLLLVSHDRAFLDNLVTSTLVFEGEGRCNEYVGGYSDWLRQRGTMQPLKPAAAKKTAPKPQPSRPKPTAKKLSYKDQRALDVLPETIERLEAEQEALLARMAEAGFYQQGGDAIAGAKERLEQIEAELLEAYDQWERLEAGA